MSIDYNLNSIFILTAVKRNNTMQRRGTCFAISKSLVLTAKHNIEDRDKYFCYLDIDSYNANDKIELELEYLDEKFDFVILKTKEYEFNEYIAIGQILTQRGLEINCCGYPSSRVDYAPIDTRIDADYSSTESIDYCFSIEQRPSVTNYKGMSGAPIMYKEYLIGILIVQEGNSVLYGISTSKILEKNNLTSKNISTFNQDVIEYNPPVCPISPFKIEVDCNKIFPNMKGLNIGFDYHNWKIDNLIKLSTEWIIDYTLSSKEKQVLSNMPITLYRNAFKNFPFNNINAINDLFLHISIRQNYKTIPVINRLFDIDGCDIFSSSHVIVNKGKLEIWLGISSILSTLEDAVISAVENLKKLITIENLNDRLILITEEQDPSWPFSEKLNKIADTNLSITDRFDKIVIPIFIANESELITSYNKETFKECFNEEINKCREIFIEKFNHDFINLIDIKIFAFPVKNINELLQKFQELNND